MASLHHRQPGALTLLFPASSQHGLSLIALIGVLGVITIGLSLVAPALVQIFNQQHQDQEDQQLRHIANGIQIYLEHHKSFPPSLASLTPDFVPLSSLQLTTNAHGFPRYYAIHPGMNTFNNSTGLSGSELANARIILITNLTQDAAPSITTPTEFENWWTMDESLIPNLHIHRRNFGNLFYSLAITPNGNGGSFLVNIFTTNSGTGLLPNHNAFHLVGTQIGFDEDTAYITPEVQFALTTNTAYWFNPLCTATKQWNPLDPACLGATGNVRDELGAIAFNGNDGAQNWVNDWQETGEADGPTSGKMQVVADLQCAAGNCFQFGGGGGGGATEVTREVDLTGATTATLTFTYLRTAGGNGGNIKIQVSGDGGGSWTNLQTYNMNGNDVSQIPQTFDITAFIAVNTQMQFVRSGNVKRFLLIDNIDISWN